jgi:hypothetical protein
MSQLFADISEVEIFIDDISIFTTGSFEDHLKVVERVLKRLLDNDF